MRLGERSCREEYGAALRDSPARARTGRALLRIGELNPAWHLFTCLTGDEALAAADASDARLRAGQPLGALDGACVAVKDNIDLRGYATTAGIGHYRGAAAAEDAPIVRRLRAAGAVIVGKTNLHEAALGGTSDNPWFGRCENPRSPGFSPGGSSGGSAAAIAAGLCSLAIGTDSMGSVRIPAAWCGVAGFKPTQGALEMSGINPLSKTLDELGMIAPGAAELASAWQALCGDNRPARDAAGLPSLRIGFLPGLLDVEVEDCVREAYELALRCLRESKTGLAPMSWPGWDAARLRRDCFALCEIEGAQVHAAALASDPQGFSPELRALLDYGARQTPQRKERIHASLQGARAMLRDYCAGVDLILLPTTPQPACRHGARPAANQADFTVPASIAGLPAVSLPWGDAPQGRVLGLQLIAPAGRDAWLLASAARIERALRAFSA